MDIKEVFEFLSIDSEKVKTLDDFKTEFNSSFFSNNNLNESPEYKKQIGKITGTLAQKAKQALKETGIDFDFEKEKDLHDGTPEGILKYGATKIKTFIESSKDDFEKKAALNRDEKLTEAEKLAESFKKKYEDTSNQLKSVATEYETAKTKFAGDLKSEKISLRRNSLMSGLQFKDGISDVEKFGFNAIIDNSYIFDLDEKGESVIRKKDGTPVWDEKKHSVELTPDQVLQNEAIKQNLFKVNPKGGNDVNQNAWIKPQNNGQNNGQQNNQMAAPAAVPISSNRF